MWQQQQNLPMARTPVVAWMMLLSLLMMVSLPTLTSAADSITCASGIGGGNNNNNNNNMIVVPPERINDGFCDCPLDGSDEPATEACAGSNHWPGMPGAATADPHNQRKFECPQQPDMQLSLSRLNDGICDCCDGADEVSGSCLDVCDDVLAAQRAERAQILENYNRGSQLLQTRIAEFDVFREETKKKIGGFSKELEELKRSEQGVEADLEVAKREYLQERMEARNKMVASSSLPAALVRDLTNDELVELIVATCQISGELAGKNGDSTTFTQCVPLRLAGLDMGFVWTEQEVAAASDISKATLVRVLENENDGALISELAGLLVENAHPNRKKPPSWELQQRGNSNNDNSNNKRKSPPPREHEALPEEDMYDEEYYGDDDYHHYSEYDEDYDDDHVPAEHSRRNRATSNKNTDTASPSVAETEELFEKTKASPLSASRLPYLQRAVSLVNKIDGLLAADLEGEEETEGGDETENQKEENNDDDGGDDVTASPVIDPMAYQMARNKLSNAKESIEHGLEYAASAKILLDAINTDTSTSPPAEQLKQELLSLAIATLYHSKISTPDFYQIMVTILPEYGGDDNNESCAAKDTTCDGDNGEGPLARLCPVRMVERNGKSFPSNTMIDHLTKFCDQCSSGGVLSSKCTDVDEEEVPSTIPDGFCGYLAPRKRSDDDNLWSEAFAAMNTLSLSDNLSLLEERLDEMEGKRNDLEQELKNLEEQMGGKDEYNNKFGPKGILYALQNTCHAVEAGKYEYEVCILGKAAQRDEGQKKGGTDLGKWEGMSKIGDNGGLQLKWTKGTKCWNGPQRSATVNVSCGPDTKLISADEPETCAYVFEMESYIACNSAYQKKHGL